jgi:hypothetical protein
MTIAKWLCFALGVLIVIGNWLSIIRTLIVPGSYNSAGIGFIRTIWRKLFHFIARKFGKNQTKHRLLSL